jgi:hypothetical protein
LTFVVMIRVVAIDRGTGPAIRPSRGRHPLARARSAPLPRTTASEGAMPIRVLFQKTASAQAPFSFMALKQLWCETPVSRA